MSASLASNCVCTFLVNGSDVSYDQFQGDSMTDASGNNLLDGEDGADVRGSGAVSYAMQSGWREAA